MPKDEADELRGEIIALETALAAAFGEIAVLRAAVEGGGTEAALGAMEAMAAQLEGSVLRGVVGAEAAGRPAAAAGFERRMEFIVHALRNAIDFRSQ
jgi:predicted exporter